MTCKNNLYNRWGFDGCATKALVKEDLKRKEALNKRIKFLEKMLLLLLDQDLNWYPKNDDLYNALSHTVKLWEDTNK